jgi:hypothetical protein
MLAMKEKLTRMTELVQENLSKAQAAQKTWYDKTARARSFEPGDRVLVLLPTSTNKLRAQWQGPYDIVRKQGEANYIVDMADKRKRHRTFHVNMLREWYDSKPLALFTTEDDEQEPGDVVL